ncbi:erythromycin esterase family protein [Propionibacteriaceae bacterium Y2011]
MTRATAPSAPSASRSTSRHRTGRTLVIIALALALVVGGIVGWRAWTTRAQGEPQAVEFAEATISPELADATVLALGEATHGNAELQLLRLSLAQKLPQFRAIALEEDYGSVAMVDDFVQGGPGTAQEAARRFGFVLNHTAEMAAVLQGIRDLNADRPPTERIQLVGIDVQRVDANRELSLGWLRQHEPAEAAAVRAALEPWTDGTASGDGAAERRAAAKPSVDRLVTAIEAAPDDERKQLALNAAVTLQQHIALRSSDCRYSEVRAELLAANMSRTVAEQRARSNDHTLLFAHNGHVDKASVAFPHPDLGELLVQEYGEKYRAIGTEVRHATLISGTKQERWQVELDNPTPLRGIFAGTEQGYLEFASATPENRELLERRVPMASAGESFRQWQAWIGPLHAVPMVPADSYDALVLVARATPVTPL